MTNGPEVRLTGEGCRAARAILNWSVRDLLRAAGVSPNTVNKVESGGIIGAEAAGRIAAAFEAHGVEILGDDRPGARLMAKP
jgi:transcriptional regulator with XRE-family HTH domain